MEKYVLLSSIVKKIPLLFFCFNFPILLVAQSKPAIDFTSIKKEQGLINNTINKVIKDDLGFLWIATNEGLHRYDGPNTVTIFKVDTIGNTNTLESNFIHTLHKDTHGNLWIGTSYGGLTRYNMYSKEWKTFRYQEGNDSSISNDEILCIYEDSQLRLWVGTENGLNLFDQRSETFTRCMTDVNDPYSIETKAVLSIMEDHQGWIWVGTWGGGLHLLLKGDIEKSKFRNFKPSKFKQSYHVWTIYQDNENRYWIGTFGGGLFLMQLPPEASNELEDTVWSPNFYNYMQDKSNETTMSNNAICDILQDRKGRLWVGTTYGLNCIESENLPDTSRYNFSIDERPTINFNKHFSSSEASNSISNNTVITLFKDNEDIIWVGTADGLNQYNWYASQFEFHEIYNEDDIIPNSSNIYVDDNQLVWLAAGNKGLQNYNLTKKTLESFTNKHPDFFLSDNVISLYGDNNQMLYVVTDLGFTILNLEDFTYRKFPSPQWFRTINPSLYIQALYVDKNQLIWFGTEQGLYTLNSKTGNYKIYEKDNDPLKSISDNSVTAICEDKNGHLWVGTFSGLNWIRRSSSGELEFHHFFHDSKNSKRTISSNQITVLKIINEELYIGTTAGLCSYNLETKEFQVYGSVNQKFWIQSMIETDRGNLWVSTIEGIFSFDITTNEIRSYGKDDGIKDSSFSLGANYKDALGNIYFGNGLGFIRYHPDNIQINEKESPVYITNVKKINPEGEISLDGILLQDMELKYNDYYLEIHFAGLNYIQPEKNRIAYQLLGFDDKWHFTKNDNPVVYTNLEPKSYTLKVKAANNSGVWNKELTVLNIEKKPAYWQTWWFQLGSMIGLVLLIFFSLQLYTNTQRKNTELAQMNEEISLAKLQSLTINMNPHFLFNAFNTLQNFILKNEKHNANQYLTNLSDIIRKLLNNSENIALPLLEEIEILKAYVNLEKERFVDVIDFEIDIEPKLLDRNPVIPSMIIQPHLENAILHGLSYSNQKGKITLILSEKEEGNLHCIVRDNGIGRTKSQAKKKQNEHLFMASQNTNDRIEILRKMGYQNADLKIKDLYDPKNLPIGTEIIITLPFLK